MFNVEPKRKPYIDILYAMANDGYVLDYLFELERVGYELVEPRKGGFVIQDKDDKTVYWKAEDKPAVVEAAYNDVFGDIKT